MELSPRQRRAVFAAVVIALAKNHAATSVFTPEVAAPNVLVGVIKLIER